MSPSDLPVGTPWWVAVILLLAFGRPALGSEIMSRVPGWLGSYARHRQGRTPEARADLTLSAAWERQDREITRLAGLYDGVVVEYGKLSQRVDVLEAKLTEMTRRFFAAVAYIRTLVTIIRRLDPEHQIPDPPNDLEAYL